jgi:hypothetical protein
VCFERGDDGSGLEAAAGAGFGIVGKDTGDEVIDGDEADSEGVGEFVREDAAGTVAEVGDGGKLSGGDGFGVDDVADAVDVGVVGASRDAGEGAEFVRGAAGEASGVVEVEEFL